MVNLTPNHYNILLEPDLEKFNFKGKTEIEIKSEEPVSNFALNSLNLEFTECTIISNGSSQKAKWEIDLEHQTVSLSFTERVQEFTVKIDYSGEINSNLVGFYRSKYKVDGEDRWAGVTQFEESDARRAFPCFDVPSKKATFDVSFIINENLVGISNSHIEEEHPLPNNKKKLIFGRTPIMSTYLLFFGIGEFNKISAETRDYEVSIIASPEHQPLNKYGQYGLDFAVKSLEFCEDYFAVKFPFTKLDNIATADFAHGAMENYGAILYRENLLLHFPGITNKRSEKYILEVIAHEITHQWFGNLVSPISWKYLWLNESFATFFGYGIVDHYYPEKRVWEDYVTTQTEAALNSDGLIQTLPIELTGEGAVGMTVKNVNILYNKGGSILRQMKDYLGEDNFREGLRAFLENFSYSNASSSDLWASLEDVSGKPVSKLMKSWILQEGYPLLVLRENGHNLEISQKRFTYLNQESDSKWKVPISIIFYFNDKEPQIDNYVLSDESMSIEMPTGITAYKINNDYKGFYRTQYPKSALLNFIPFIKEDKLSPIDHYSLEVDLFALLKANRMEFSDYLEFVKNYIQNTNTLAVSSISGHLRTLYSAGDDRTRMKISIFGKEFLENVLNKIGYVENIDEDQAVTTLRGDLLSNAVLFGSKTAEDFVMSQFKLFKQGNSIPADILTAILAISAQITNDIIWFTERFENAENEELSVKLINALGKFTNKDHIEKMQTYTFDKVPMRNRRILISSLCSNLSARGSVWHWFLANLDNFEKLHSFSYQLAIVEISRESSHYFDDVQEFFRDYVKRNISVSDAVDVALETLEIRKNLISHINR